MAVVPQGLLVAPDAPRLAMVADAASGIMAWPECPPGMACALGMPWQPVQPKVHVQLMDASTPDTMPAPQRLQFDGRLVGTRQVGRMLYVVALHLRRSWPSTCCRWCRARPTGRRRWTS